MLIVKRNTPRPQNFGEVEQQFFEKTKTPILLQILQKWYKTIKTNNLQIIKMVKTTKYMKKSLQNTAIFCKFFHPKDNTKNSAELNSAFYLSLSEFEKLYVILSECEE